MIHRDKYIKRIRPFYDSDLIKIITGIRRCGKSVLMSQIEDELRAKGKPIISLNFEDRAIFLQIPNEQSLISYIKGRLQLEKTYVFLDEIQNVDNWNYACRTLRLENVSLFITGSNSKLLSKEFTKELSGRYVSFDVRPFVYTEIMEYSKELGQKFSINDYLIYGGFPKILEFNDKDAIIRYLNDLNDTIVMNDIMNRYNIRKPQLFRRLVDYVLISNARIFSVNSMHRYLQSQKLDCSVNTVIKYLSYLEEAYVIRQISQFSNKAKRKLNFYSKLYDEDVSFNTIRQTGGRYDLTHNLENIVYNELIYREFQLSVYNSGDKEIDFLAEKDNKQYLIQVAYSIVDNSTYQREFALFSKLDQSIKKIIITNDDIDFSTSTVQHISLKDFLVNGIS